MSPPNSSWPKPARILLLTYDRADHISTSYRSSLIGVAGDRANATKLKQMRKDDWVLIRISTFPGFQASRPARIVGKVIDQRRGSPYPELLWEEEIETSAIVYPLRIPVSFADGPRTKPGCVNWESLAALRLRGKDGAVLEDPQQWGIKFKTNVLADPSEVDAMLDLIARCAA